MRLFFNSLKPLFFLFLGLGLLWVAFSGIDYKILKETIRSISLKWVFLSMVLGYLAFVFRALRWFLLIKPLGYNPKIFYLIHAIAFGYLFNSFIPRSGEIVRCTALNKVAKIPVSQLFGHVLLERLIDVILLCSCIVLSLILNYDQFRFFAQDFKLPKNIILYFSFLVLFIFSIYRWRRSFLQEEQISKINMFFKGIKSGFMSINKIQNKWMFFIYTILIWLCYLLMTMVCFYCFSDMHAFGFKQGLFILVAGGLGMVMPTPTGIGSYHYLVKKALVVFGIGPQIAFTFAFIVHTSQAVMIILAGFLAMFSLYFKSIKSS